MDHLILFSCSFSYGGKSIHICFDTLDINASCFLHIPQFVCLDVLTGKHKNRKSSCHDAEKVRADHVSASLIWYVGIDLKPACETRCAAGAYF